MTALNYRSKFIDQIIKKVILRSTLTGIDLRSIELDQCAVRFVLGRKQWTEGLAMLPEDNGE
jgi:hypothetical protein